MECSATWQYRGFINQYMGRAQEGLSLATLARGGRLILRLHHTGPKDPPEGWRGFLSCSSKQSSSAEASGPLEGG